MSSESESTLTGRLRICAKMAGSGDALSAITGIPRRTLENYLSGESEPKITRVVEIADAVGVYVEWLATGRGPMRKIAEDALDDPIPFEDEGEKHAVQQSKSLAFRADMLPVELKQNPPHADEDLMSTIGELVASVHRHMGISLPPSQLFRITARRHNEVMASQPSAAEIPGMLKLLETQLRAELREAQSKPGTGKRLA